MIAKVLTILECSRFFSLPMSLLSWLVIFSFCLFKSGNVLNGILALIGICFAHLATNIIDDFLDYKSLIKQVGFDKKEYLKNTQKTKCRYLVSGQMSEAEVLRLIFIYLGIACFIGLVLFLRCGMGVLYYALAGGFITLTYSVLSRIRLSEVAVGLAYGPILFGGVYYVMTKAYSYDALILSIPTMFVTIILLYIHTVMDYDYDLNEGHQTVANSFNSQLESLIVLKILLVLAYISPIFICIFDILDWQVLLTWLTIPLGVDLYKSMESYSVDSEDVPTKKWYHFPMENVERIKSMNALSFMFRMYQSRNLLIYFAIFMIIGIFLSLGV